MARHNLFMKVDAIQKCYQVVDIAMKDVCIKEREARLSQAKFQEAIVLVSQRDELIRQLQAGLDLTEGTSVDISAFQTQALEINEKLEMAQQDLFMKVDAI